MSVSRLATCCGSHNKVLVSNATRARWLTRRDIGMTTRPNTPQPRQLDRTAPVTHNQTSERTAQDTAKEALKPPVGDPIPHPALDVPSETIRAEKRGLDTVVFGISAVV